MRDACARHLRDLQDLPAQGFVWDVAAVDWHIAFFREVLRLAGGDHEGKPFILEPWQAFVVGSIFGWKMPHESDGQLVRRFQRAFVETGKGSGKSPLAAGIGLLGLVADGEARAEIYAGAAKLDQAKVLFRDAVAMVRQSPALSARLGFSGGPGKEFNIDYLATGSFFRPVATENQGVGQSGPRPHMALLDEIHEHKTDAMVEFFTAGFKGRRQPLIFMITNSGVDRTSVAFQYHEYGAAVCKAEPGDVNYNPHFFAYICALDEGDDPFDPVNGEACWAKANPTLGVTITAATIRKQVQEARGMPAKESLVRRLHFCQWVDAANPWIEGDLWRECVVQPDAFPSDAALKDVPCFLALDLSGKLDLTALSAVWPITDEAVRLTPDEHVRRAALGWDVEADSGEADAALSFAARTWFWTPADSMPTRARKDRVPYPVWVRDGYLMAVPGLSIDYAYVAAFVAELRGHFNVVGLAFDRYRMDDFKRELDALGVDNWEWKGPDSKGQGIALVRHGQGFAGGADPTRLWMTRSIGVLEDSVLGRSAVILHNPVLTWNSASAVIVQDAAENRMWDKRKATGRIDGIVSLSMAAGLAALLKAQPVRESVYETRGVRFIPR